jgi:hypothetical protein
MIDTDLIVRTLAWYPGNNITDDMPEDVKWICHLYQIYEHQMPWNEAVHKAREDWLKEYLQNICLV